MESIQAFWKKFKYALDERGGEWFVPIIVILVGFSAFGLGRFSAEEKVRPVVSVKTASSSEVGPRSMQIGGLVVASRSGNAYHFPWCPGAETMKESNKVWFKDESAAKKAGYLPAKNCDGLR